MASVISKKFIAKKNVKKFFYIYSSNSLTVTGLVFKSLIHFEFIFIYGVR
jgi:hypothetical protein